MPKSSSASEHFRQLLFCAPKDPRRFLTFLFLFAWVLRLAVMFAMHSYRTIDYGDDHFGFGWEMGRVARSLAQGNGFSSPLPLPTGPTAIVGPVYPLLLALVFKIFGVYSISSAIAIRILQSIFASLTCVFVYLCGRDTAGAATAKLAAVAWAIFPLNIFFTVTKVWETSLTGMLAALLFWYMLQLRDSLSISRWAATGALLGIVGLLNTSLVMLVVPFGLFALWKNRVRAILPATVGALTCLAMLSPWIVRNHAEFGKFVLRSNFPLEFRVGNNELSHGEKIERFHPSNTPELNRHWQEVGEVRFMAEDREANSLFVSTHAGRFAFATFSRIVNYWTALWLVPTADSPNLWPAIFGTSILSLFGLLGLRQMFSIDNSVAWLYAGCLLIYPMVYYLTTTQPRFYHTISPLLVLLGSFWLVNFIRRVAVPDDARANPETGALTGKSSSGS
jgi:4-amino-4-deoxy-L-arabinose transferase-like glycosyltransferase